VPCEACGGDGRWRTDDGRHLVARDADGNPLACEACDGEGVWRNTDRFEVAPGYVLMGWYVALLFENGCKCYLPVEAGRAWGRDINSGHPMRFTNFDGVEGVLMPCSPDEETY
jgi:hypothetical protein